MSWPRVLLLAITLVLGACAGQAKRASVELDWEQHSAQLQQLESWTASGKLALRTADKAESATLQWQQQAGESHLSLSGPMGMNAVTVHSDGQRMQVQRADQSREFDVSTPDAILHNTGWELPLQALPYWLKGAPSPRLPVQSMELDSERDLLRALQQDDWQIDYLEYEDFHGLTLPTRLQIQRASTVVKIILRDWQTHQGE